MSLDTLTKLPGCWTIGLIGKRLRGAWNVPLSDMLIESGLAVIESALW